MLAIKKEAMEWRQRLAGEGKKAGKPLPDRQSKTRKRRKDCLVTILSMLEK